MLDYIPLTNTKTQIATKLLGGSEYRQIIFIVGMPGLGKTTIAKNLYRNSNVRSHFDKLSWCVVSQTYRKRKVLIDILSSISNLDRDIILKMEDEDMALHLYQSLKGRRYLVVMDDIWDISSWHELKKYFPNDKSGSRILLTSRQKDVAKEITNDIVEPPPLSKDKSWDLLKQNVFENGHCPQELQDIGNQIAENCKGLPLLLVVIASVLSNMEKIISSWQKFATSTSPYISEKADDFLSILKLSYNHLPIHLKPCFLYLSAFEEDAEISGRKLSLLWIAEGFIEKKGQKNLEDIAEEYLTDLINKSLLQAARRRSDNGVRSCIIHDLLLEMCRKVADEEYFLFQQ
ncbi:Putative late blight resistance protein homolog R1B-16 [Olea europaea subsp. europaea]|uniref:Late blight resistance protein homolog R1B-16 n=1 Tax=Olea europaea subsp. europaea TaxID=158383 RepID=A0A8S0V855_OLEEU|nr:Putative late blight resistance protein homolog R1B-16 [Olea europaea subsp. europaea]